MSDLVTIVPTADKQTATSISAMRQRIAARQRANGVAVPRVAPPPTAPVAVAPVDLAPPPPPPPKRGYHRGPAKVPPPTAYVGTETPFGLALERLRRDRGLTQVMVADAAGIDHSMMSRLEHGQRMPSRGMVLRLAAAVSATVGQRDALLIAAGFAGDGNDGPDALIADLRDLLRSPGLNEREQSAVRNTIAVVIGRRIAAEAEERLSTAEQRHATNGQRQREATGAHR